MINTWDYPLLLEDKKESLSLVLLITLKAVIGVDGEIGVLGEERGADKSSCATYTYLCNEHFQIFR